LLRVQFTWDHCASSRWVMGPVVRWVSMAAHVAAAGWDVYEIHGHIAREHDRGLFAWCRGWRRIVALDLCNRLDAVGVGNVLSLPVKRRTVQ
jgi:hypothetical protein